MAGKNHMKTITMMVDGAAEAPFMHADLVRHLANEAKRATATATELRRHATHMSDDAAAACIQNAQLFEEYAAHLTSEAGRCAEGIPTPASIPYVKPEEELIGQRLLRKKDEV